MTGCASGARIASVPDGLVDNVSVAGMTNIRYWGDEVSPSLASIVREKIAQTKASRPNLMRPGAQPEINYLAISGGGSNGAFGAGVLVGWSDRGTRPEFEVVTGISTGALAAPFAFLGKRYDPILKEIYTTYTTKDFLRIQPIKGLLSGDALSNNEPFQNLIAKYVDKKLIAEIAKEHRKGRRLFIGTTNLDAQRPIVWDAGKIAASDHPQSVSLLRQIFLASASVPGVFPPVMIKVKADGKVFAEMHVDGGTTHQVILLPGQLNLGTIAKDLGVKPRLTLYVIRNARLNPEPKQVPDKTISIAARSVSTLIKYQGIGDLYELSEYAQQNDIHFKLAFIQGDFKDTSTEVFDKQYMGELFDVAYRRARKGYPWKNTPLGAGIGSQIINVGNFN